jgi:hypothetical protein
VRGAVSVILLLALTGCGNQRTQPPDVDHPQPPQGERTVRLKEAGVRFTAPGNWPDIGREEPREGGVRSGRATVAVWRYTRAQALPDGEAELEQVRDLLLERVKARDPTYEERSTRIVRRAGVPGIELVGRQTLSGSEVDVRSTHLYARGSEYVIDAYAPPDHFETLDDRVFIPLLRSLRIGA